MKNIALSSIAAFAAILFLVTSYVPRSVAQTAAPQVAPVSHGRFTLTASGTTNGIYRLDTATGAIVWCRPTGDEKSGYRLVCQPELTVAR